MCDQFSGGGDSLPQDSIKGVLALVGKQWICTEIPCQNAMRISYLI